MRAAPLDIVIPTYGRPDNLRRCLAHVAAQTARGLVGRVLVVDDASPGAGAGDACAALGGALPLTLLRHERNRGAAAARNTGIAAATAPACLLLDDDVLLAPDALARFAEAGLPDGPDAPTLLGHVSWDPSVTVTPFMYWMEHGGPQFAYDRIRDPDDCGWPFYGTSAIVTATALLREHRFDEGFPGARYEDLELGWRLERAAGHRIRLVRRATAGHLHTATLPDWLGRADRHARSAVHFAHIAGDRRVADAIGVTAAEALTGFRWEVLDRAAGLIAATEGSVRVPPAPTCVFGELAAWEALAAAYRVVQNFFHLTGLRRALALPALGATDAPLECGEARSRLLRRLPPD